MPGVGMCRPYGVGVGEPHAEVRLFEEQPATGTKPRDHPTEDFDVVRNVHEHGARVDEIEGLLRKPVRANVMT